MGHIIPLVGSIIFVSLFDIVQSVTGTPLPSEAARNLGDDAIEGYEVFRDVAEHVASNWGNDTRKEEAVFVDFG